MSCEIWQNELDRYLDGELPEEQQRALRQHLDGCPACAKEALGRVQLKRSIASAGRRYQPSAEFRARIAKQAGRRPASASHWSWWRTAVPLAAAMAILLVTFFVNLSNERRRILDEVADLHATNLASGNPVDVVSTDKHTVKPWFQGKLPFTFDLPELTGTQFELLGGRMVFLEQEPAAYLLYGIRKHKVTVLIAQDRGDLKKLGMQATSARSFHVESWQQQQGLRYIVISDAGAQDVHALAELFRRGALQ